MLLTPANCNKQGYEMYLCSKTVVFSGGNEEVLDCRGIAITNQASTPFNWHVLELQIQYLLLVLQPSIYKWSQQNVKIPGDVQKQSVHVIASVF